MTQRPLRLALRGHCNPQLSGMMQSTGKSRSSQLSRCPHPNAEEFFYGLEVGYNQQRSPREDHSLSLGRFPTWLGATWIAPDSRSGVDQKDDFHRDRPGEVPNCCLTGPRPRRIYIGAYGRGWLLAPQQTEGRRKEWWRNEDGGAYSCWAWRCAVVRVRLRDDARAEAIVEPHEVEHSIYYGGDILTMAGHEPEYAEAVRRGGGRDHLRRLEGRRPGSLPREGQGGGPRRQDHAPRFHRRPRASQERRLPGSDGRPATAAPTRM